MTIRSNLLNVIKTCNGLELQTPALSDPFEIAEGYVLQLPDDVVILT